MTLASATATAASLALVSLTLVGACGHDAPEDVQSDAVVPVATAPVETGAIRATIRATGLVVPAPGADLIVIAPEAARVAAIPKGEGDAVRRGDLLVRFDIPTVDAGVASRRAEVERAQARLTNARAAQTRARDLFERGVAARKEVEDADRELAEAQAGLAEAEATRAAAETVSARTTIHATFDGIIARRLHNPGDIVEASASDPVLRVIDPRRLEVTASVPLAEASHVVLGARARVRDPSTEEPIAMKVASRPSMVDPGTAAIQVRLAFTVPTKLAAGTPVQVEIDGEERRDVALVPQSAIVREGDETAVFVALDGKAHRRVVATGLADGQRVEVRTGVKPGEQVITRGQAGLPDGAAISPAAAQP